MNIHDISLYGSSVICKPTLDLLGESQFQALLTRSQAQSKYNDLAGCYALSSIDFEYQGISIIDPFTSECGRFAVDPLTYYGDAFKDSAFRVCSPVLMLTETESQLFALYEQLDKTIKPMERQAIEAKIDEIRRSTGV